MFWSKKDKCDSCDLTTRIKALEDQEEKKKLIEIVTLGLSEGHREYAFLFGRTNITTFVRVRKEDDGVNIIIETGNQKIPLNQYQCEKLRDLIDKHFPKKEA
jgi:hypothetical protein